jgi:DnaJ-class molecular chaperone
LIKFSNEKAQLILEKNADSITVKSLSFFGDEYVKIIVEVPKDLNREQKEKLTAFDGSLNDKNYKKRKSFFDKVKELFDD